MVHGFDSISITQFPVMICAVSAEGSLNRVAHSIQIFVLLTLSKLFLFNLCTFAASLPLSLAQSYLVIFHLLAQSHDIGNQNFVSLHSGFIIIDFDGTADMQCYHYSSNVYFWFGYLVGVTCSSSQELTNTHSVLPIASSMLHFQHQLIPLCFALAHICFWLNWIVQFKSKFSLSCAVLRKVSTEDGDHVISQMVALIAEIEGNCFYIILSILLVWRRSDLFSVSLQITGYVSLDNQTPLHITLSKMIFTSHCICFYYIMICPVSSAYTIGVVSFA